MTVVMVSTAPDRDVYDRVSKFVNISGDRPAGLILHAAAELPTGEVQIFDVWDSEESISAFAEQRMMPAFTEAGASAPCSPALVPSATSPSSS